MKRVAPINALSTLLPHLSHGRVHDFRWAFVTGLTLVTVLYLGGLIAAALLLGALLVPALYLLYLHEAHMAKQEPVGFSVLAMAGGAVLGTATAALVDGMQGVRALELTRSAALLVALAVGVPVLQELIKPLPALVLRGRPGFADPIDGLTLGIASGLGLALAQTMVTFSGVVAALPLRVDPSAWIYPLTTAAVLLPLLQATCAGAVTVAVWNAGSPRRLSGIPVALLAHVAFTLGSELLSERGPGHVAVIVWQGVIVAAMILYIRRVLQATLGRDPAPPAIA